MTQNTPTGLGRTSWFLIASAVVLGTVYIFIVYGGRLPVSFSGNPQDASIAAQRRRLQDPAAWKALVGINGILQMKDRRAALVALCKILLARIVASQGVLLQDSWTDRDTLRRVPHGYPLRDALQDLVFASERVQFGGRDVTEEEFKAHVSQLRPLWSEAGQT